MGGLSIELPEGGRFPVVTTPTGERWSLADSLPSDSTDTLAALRVSPSFKKIAFILEQQHGPSLLQEVLLESGKTKVLAEMVHDAVYLPDGTVVASILENEQPRRAIRIASETTEVLKAAPKNFLRLSVREPSVITETSWDGLEKRFEVLDSGVVRPVSPAKMSTISPKFGCESFNEDATLNARCETRTVISADGTSVPISVFNAHAKGPVYVKVYGAYGISLAAPLSLRERYFLEHGATIAWLHIRGGGELGPQWHAAGRGSRRQRAVEDLVAGLALFGQRKVILSTSSAGAISAIAAMRSANPRPTALILDSPLLDVVDTQRRFKDDEDEFHATPPNLLPLTVAAESVALPPTLLLCGTSDPLVSYRGCEKFANLRPTVVTLLAEDRERHSERFSRTVELEREVGIIRWAIQFMPAL